MKIMADLAAERGWAWQVECVRNPDEVLAATAETIVTATASCWTGANDGST
jgi:hypothetical protein